MNLDLRSFSFSQCEILILTLVCLSIVQRSSSLYVLFIIQYYVLEYPVLTKLIIDPFTHLGHFLFMLAWYVHAMHTMPCIPYHNNSPNSY